MNERKLPKQEKTIRHRDLHIMQRVGSGSATAWTVGQTGYGVDYWNNSIPPRLHLSDLATDSDVADKGCQNASLKLLRREWRKSVRRVRGWMYPPLRWAERFVSVCRRWAADSGGEGDGSDYLEPMSAILCFDGFGRKPT